MKIKERTDKFTDKGWNKLYSRLQQDGLLDVEDSVPARNEDLIIHEDFRDSINRTYPDGLNLKWLYIAGGLVACICFAFILFINISGDAMEQNLITLQNKKGAPTLVTTLEDGSVIYLSDLASIQYPQQFAGTKREINLQGNAFFEISRDKEKPFFIETSLATIEVLGTAFDVKAGNENSFSLSVKNGEVKVTSKKSGKTTHVKAGERVSIESGSLTKEKVSGGNLFDNYFNQIQFKDEKLIDVAHIINMNSDSIQLKISPDIADRMITMTVTNDSPATVAQLISLALNLKYKQEQDIITIYR